MNSNFEYVPYPLSDHIFKTFKSGKIQKRSSREILATIDSLRPILANFYLPESELTYTNILYPHDVAKILALSRTDKWPNYNIDEIVEFIVTNWIKENVKNPSKYLTDLWNAIRKTECEIGMMARLNADAIAKTSFDRVKISTKYGVITQESHQKSTLDTATRQKIKHLLQHEFVNDSNILYERISALHRHHTIEQTILSWIGYMAVRTILISSPAPIAFNGQLLIQQPKMLNISAQPSNLQT